MNELDSEAVFLTCRSGHIAKTARQLYGLENKQFIAFVLVSLGHG